MRDYYRSHWIRGPKEISKREFGYSFTPGRKIEKRHESFTDEKALNEFLRTKAPLYISYSVGYFKFPSETPMENKVLLGSDLIFEFDADEVGLYSERDVWICDNCGANGYGYREKCPKCGSPVRIEMFPDPDREEEMKSRVDSLIQDFLIGDLGIGEEEISVNFSGNRGYHIHVLSEKLRHLDKEARMEIVEYVTGQSIDPLYLFGEATPCRDLPILCIKGPKPSDPGWPGRIARNVLRVLSEGDEEILRRAGLEPDIVKAIVSNADIYRDLIGRGLWPSLQIKRKHVPLRIWVDIAKSVTPLSGYEIDTNTSVDIHRLIRLPDTIHGTTGLVAKRVVDLESFDPYTESIVLPSREITVKVKISPEFEMRGHIFGPYEDEVVKLPLYVAYYLIGRGVAEWRLTSTG